MSNDQGYRYLRTVDSRSGRVRAVLVVALAVVCSVLAWFLLFVIVFVLRSPCALCVR